MGNLTLISKKTLIGFEEFLSWEKFQFPTGIYKSLRGEFYLSFINPIFEDIFLSKEVSGRIKLPENFVIEKYHLSQPASCIEMRSEVGLKRAFTMKTFLASIWSLLYEQGKNFSEENFIQENRLYLFPVEYHYGDYMTASVMFCGDGSWSINIHPQKLAPYREGDTWSVSSEEGRGTYLLVPVID